MSQLTKGGKYGLSWSTVGTEGSIVIPPETYAEYQFSEAAQWILLSCSKTSGGFVLGTLKSLRFRKVNRSNISTQPVAKKI